MEKGDTYGKTEKFIKETFGKIKCTVVADLLLMVNKNKYILRMDL